MKPQSPLAQTDGRRERGALSRANIVAAMLDLVAGGDVSPSAARVAEEAGVGLRTVFRHFADMDSLYREMADVIEARVLPIMLQPMQASDWRGRVRELARRRPEVFETILPYRVSAEVRRFESAFLMQGQKRMLRMERTSLEAVLPERIVADTADFNAFLAALGFQTWRFLRMDQELPVAAARAALERMVEALIAQAGAD